MRLKVEHKTRFTYDAPVREAYSELRLRPLDAGGQRCLGFTLVTEPRAAVRGYRDRHGNDVRHFDCLGPHQELIVTSTSEVLTPEAFGDPEASLSPLDAYDYLGPTEYAPHGDAVRFFAGPHEVSGDRMATVLALTEAVRQALRYEKGATDVRTPADEALARGRGVCQDFAHLLLAGCRVLGIPGRYVSGYVLPDGEPGDQAASHAWVDVFLAGVGWISLDPTHGRPQTSQYVRVAVGRDYAEVPPTRGVFKGPAQEALAVEVRVVPL
jgi:transglutaminase-like putative cysteine protease